MATLTDIKFEPLGIAEVLRRDRLRVPLNQREYSWEEEHIDDLFGDISDALSEGRETYFLGTIVLNTPKDGPPIVVDGQQRLATTCILLAAMRDYMISHGDKDFGESIEKDFLCDFDRATREHIGKLTLNVDDSEFFRQAVVCRPDNKERIKVAEPKKDSHNRILKARALATERVRLLTKVSNNPDARIHDWIKFLENRAVVIVVRAPDELNVFSMFETLNDRGLRTTQADMVKNYLFEKAGDAINDAQHHWSQMQAHLEALGIEDIVLSYLRHLTLATYGPCEGKAGFFERIRDKVKSKTAAIRFLQQIAIYADDYAAALCSTHNKWREYPGRIKEAIDTMASFGVAQIRPLMLAVSRHFKPKEAEKAFRAFVCWTTRFLICGGMRGQRLEDAYAKAAHEVVSGKIDTAKGITDHLRDVLPTDARFESSFATVRCSTAPLARYYLRALEAAAKNEDDHPEVVPTTDTTVLNLEHILPKELSSDWAHALDYSDAYCNRIGNLVLLNAKKNVLVGNSGFREKRDVFRESAIVLTRRVFESTKPTTQWGKTEIEKRQADLAKLAVKTWPL